MSWSLGPFERHPGAVLGPTPELSFRCPVTGDPVAWAAKDVFNPGAVVHDGRVHLLVRCEDEVGPIAGVSRIGLASSDDGLAFELQPEPVLFPDGREDAHEWPGGCEDPRVVESPDGGFVCTYTGFAGRRPLLMVATSPDLRTWTKHGLAFAGTTHAERSAKSGAIVTEVRDGRLVAARLDGRYWMYWGEGTCFAATSDDLVRWAPVEFDATGDRSLSYDAERGWAVEWEPGVAGLLPLLRPRRTRFDSRLVEPGPPAVRTDDGIVLVYNGANAKVDGDPTLADRAYGPGQALFDLADPTACLARATEPFLRPESSDEQAGQVDNVCFAEGLVRFRDRWFLYFGMADSKVGVAVAG